MSLVIEARGLEKSYGTTQVLRGVDLDVRSGEVRMELSIADGRAYGAAGDAVSALRTLLAWAAGHSMASLEGLTVTPPGLEDAYLRIVGPTAAQDR